MAQPMARLGVKVLLIGMLAAFAVVVLQRDKAPADPQTSAVGACERLWELSMGAVRGTVPAGDYLPRLASLAEGTVGLDEFLPGDIEAMAEADARSFVESAANWYYRRSVDIDAIVKADAWSYARAAAEVAFRRCLFLGWSGPTEAELAEIPDVPPAPCPPGWPCIWPARYP